MTDDLNRLKDLISQANPSPDAEAKSRALALAQKSFAAHQESEQATRPMHNRPEKPAGFMTGVKAMFSRTRLRPMLYATSSLAVLGVGLLLVLPMETGQLTQPVAGLKAPPSGFSLGSSANRGAVFAPELEQADISAQGANAPEPELGIAETRNLEVVPRSISPEPIGQIADSDRERFANADPNPLKITAESPVSTFSIDVDTSAYAYVRSVISNGALPRPEAVRVEEMINYFPYDYAAPTQGAAPFSTTVSVFPTPWNAQTKLVRIGIQGQTVDTDNRPPLDLVFLIDTSGSMQDANKLPLLKQSFRLLLGRLGPQDRISIVTYAGSSGVVLPPTAASDRAAILSSLERLEAGGSTAGQEGLQLAYRQAELMHETGRTGRIILATDGDFNVGISNPEDLKKYVEKQRQSGTFLSVLGFGRGNYNDALMQALAQNGNGTASYIDTLSEAQKVLADQAAAALFPIANDVKIQIEFNPAAVAEYRLIGYETRALAREDFNNDRVDAGDIGAGHQVTALYEITPVGSPATKSDPLRYRAATAALKSSEIGFLKLRYKRPGQTESQLIETAITDTDAAPDDDARFASAIAGFGQLLRGDEKYLGDC